MLVKKCAGSSFLNLFAAPLVAATLASSGATSWAQGQADVQAPSYCDAPQGGAQKFICEDRTLWTTHAVFEWELETAVEALGERGKVEALEKLKSLAATWREALGKGCHWNLPGVEMRNCLQNEFGARTVELVELVRGAGVETPELAEAMRRESIRTSELKAAEERLKKQAADEAAAAQARRDAEIRELKARFDAQRAAKEAEVAKESQRNLLFLVAIGLAGLAACAALYWVLARRRTSSSGPEVSQGTESPASLPSASSRFALYGAAMAALGAVGVVFYVAYQADMEAMANRPTSPAPAAYAPPTVASPAAPAQVARPLTADETRKLKIEAAIVSARHGTPLCQAYGRNLEVRWRLFESTPGLSVAILYEVVTEGEANGCWR